jgi:hypothetical protein
MSGKDVTRGPSAAVAAFVESLRRLPGPAARGATGRLIFALDATASREPTWDLATQVQGEMFVEAGRVGGLEVQLVFYRGFGECKSSAWARDGQELVRLMRGVRCVAGKTQIARVLRHAINETRRRPVQALVFVGDCMEEEVDELGRLAGEFGLLGVRAFLFHEGQNAAAARAFGHIAELTRGACLPFSPGSAHDLRALLGGVAAYAAGGRAALAALANRSGGAAAAAVKRLEHQLR